MSDVVATGIARRVTALDAWIASMIAGEPGQTVDRSVAALARDCSQVQR